jgi:hypothetical protein
MRAYAGIENPARVTFGVDESRRRSFTGTRRARSGTRFGIRCSDRQRSRPKITR